MPIKDAAKKYLRASTKRAEGNRKTRGVFRSAVKRTREAVTEGKVEDAQTWLKTAIKAIDKAAQKKVIKRNTAARKKSRLNALVKKAAGK